jgi:transposase
LWNQIQEYLLQHGVTVVTLPTYSPELNPCELVFARVKRHLRSESVNFYDQETNLPQQIPFQLLLATALEQISDFELGSYYRAAKDSGGERFGFFSDALT